MCMGTCAWEEILAEARSLSEEIAALLVECKDCIDEDHPRTCGEDPVERCHVGGADLSLLGDDDEEATDRRAA